MPRIQMKSAKNEEIITVRARAIWNHFNPRNAVCASTSAILANKSYKDLWFREAFQMKMKRHNDTEFKTVKITGLLRRGGQAGETSF